MQLGAVTAVSRAPELTPLSDDRRDAARARVDSAEVRHGVTREVPEPLREAVQLALRGAAELHYEHVDASGETVDYQAQGVMALSDGRQIALDVRATVDPADLEAALSESAKLSVASVRTSATSLGVKVAIDLNGDGSPDRVTTIVAAAVDAQHERENLLGHPR